MRVYTRDQLIRRLEADRQERITTTATYTRELVRRQLDVAWAAIWQYLTDGEAGFGINTATLTAPTAGPTLDLPSEFLSLHSLRRGAVADPPLRTTYKEALRLNLDRVLPAANPYTPGYFLIEAPLVGTLASQRLRFYPVLAEGEAVTLVYTTQPPSLANSDGTYGDTLGDAEDLTIAVDVYDDSLASACVGLARAALANRADSKEYQLALGQAGDVAARAVASRSKQDQGPPMPLSGYRTTNTWGRF